MNRPLETNRTVSIRPVAAVVAVPGRAMLPLPQGADIYRQVPTTSPCRHRAAPSRQEPSIVLPARGTSVRPAVTRVRYFPPPEDGPNRSHASGPLNPPAPPPSAYPLARFSIGLSRQNNPMGQLLKFLPAGTSKALSEAGVTDQVPGRLQLQAGRRAHNFVVFDPADATVIGEEVDVGGDVNDRTL